jgi:hypothetical protein
MKGICTGSIKTRKGLPSKKQACEYVQGQSPKGLPRKVRRKRSGK